MPQPSVDREGAGGDGEKKGGIFKWLASGAGMLALALLGYGIHEVLFNDILTIAQSACRRASRRPVSHLT